MFALADGQTGSRDQITDDQKGIWPLIIPDLQPSSHPKGDQETAGISCRIAGLGNQKLVIVKDRIVLTTIAQADGPDGDLGRVGIAGAGDGRQSFAILRPTGGSCVVHGDLKWVVVVRLDIRGLVAGLPALSSKGMTRGPEGHHTHEKE